MLKGLMVRAASLFFCLKNIKKLRLRGFPFILHDLMSAIEIEGKVTLNSSPTSNLIGIYQRCILVARDGGRIFLGENVGLSGVTVYSMAKITIGKNTQVGANVKIIDNDFHPLEPEARLENDRSRIRKEEIFIGDDCFIGVNAIILKGTRLGKGCIVGAGSVVKGKYEDYSVLAGNPAKFIRTLH